MKQKQAIIIGGSIAGLSAARAVSPYFEKVIIVERDENPNTYQPRKAIPQGYHIHVLLRSGENALNTLFPNLSEELVKCGAHHIESSNEVRWHHGGVWKIRYDSGIKIMVQSRPLLEQLVRERIHQFDNIEFYYGYQVKNLILSDNATITGVHLEKMADHNQTMILESDLVIDASGRGSKTSQWLQELGFSAPEETSLKIDLSYSTRLYQAPEDEEFDWRLLLINPQAPDVLRGGYIFPIENKQCLITFAGYSGETTPQDNESFAEFARGLAQPDMFGIIQKLEPISDVKYHSVPKTSRRHYEKLKDMPQGLVVMGDASCMLDPVFGQGMSVAALQAQALSEMLATETKTSLGTLGKRFHKKAATIAEVPWMLSSSEDFRFPNTVGTKPLGLPFLHWYSQQIYELSASDEEVFSTFVHVMHLLKGAETLFKPTVAMKVIKHAFTK